MNSDRKPTALITKCLHIFITIFFYNFMYHVFILGCAGSLLLHWLFLWLWEAGATLQLRCLGFSLRWLLLLQSMGSRVHGLQQLRHVASVVAAPRLYSTGSVVVAHRPSCSATYPFPDQGSNPGLLHWQADSTIEPPGECPLYLDCVVVIVSTYPWNKLTKKNYAHILNPSALAKASQ